MDSDDSIADAVVDRHILLADSIRKQKLDLPYLAPDCCIYRVPRRIREQNAKAHTRPR